MVVFSLLLIAVILFRREGLMGTREISWEGIAAWLRQRRKA
jgi:branched-chain amino acid transport system permease protein